MSNIFVDVLTPDTRFGRMLTLEIERLGADVSFGEYRSNVFSNGIRRFVIADLDAYTDSDLDAVDSSCTLIGFSTKYEYEIPSLVQECNVFLRRPFLVNELLDIIVGDDVANVANATPKNRVTCEQRAKNNVLRVNSEKRCAVWGNREMPLSENEYRVLEFLCARRGTLVLRSDIDELLGVENGNMSDVYICHLRAKLDNRLGLKLICTVRGKGYILNN